MKKITKIFATPKKLETPNDLGEKAMQKISAAINPLLADVFAIYVKTKSFHWHISGRHYRDYHLLLDEQAEQIFAMIDILAERIRKLGGMTIQSISHIKELQRIEDEDELGIPAHAMLKKLLKDNQFIVARMREAHAICSQFNDVATTSLLENFIDEAERRIWFLFETISD